MITNDLTKVVNEGTAFIKANVPSGYDVNHIQFPNTIVSTPNNEKYIRCTWNNLGPISKDASNCYVITEGIWSIDFVLPKGTGDIHGIVTAESLKAIISANNFDEFWVEDTLVFTLPEEENFYIIRLDVTYQYEGFNNANYS